MLMQIDVFHDTVCPWCRIGKQNLKLALEQWQGEPVEINYHTFFLDPGLPADGTDFKSHMLAKGNHQIPLEQFFDPPCRMGDAVGLNFNFEQIEKAPNTLLSHQLIALAPPEKKETIIDAVYAAYFEQGQDIGSLDVLVDIAQTNELDSGSIREQLLANAARDEVLAEAQWAQQQRINGVPFFIFNQKYAFSGAQPPEVILQAMTQAAEKISG